MLQVRLVERINDDDMSPSLLGQRYTLAPIEVDEHSLFIVHRHHSPAIISRIDEEGNKQDLLCYLKRIGTTALDISKGSYHVACTVQGETAGDDSKENVSVQVVLSLCHALSGGPGALRVARSFLQHLGDVLDGIEASNRPTPALTDLQSLILGSDYAEKEQPKPVFDGQSEFAAVLGASSLPIKLDDGTTVLPPEAMQNIPHDPGFGGPSFIDCVHFSLTAQETLSLRLACRKRGATIQGALAAASLRTRLALLGDQLNVPVLAAVQVPVNARFLVSSVNEDECLCGSAGVWHTARVLPPEDSDLFTLAKRSTQSVRAALQGGTTSSSQPREWLRRLFHAPATLPPYSLMVSSIGVAPIDAAYGKHKHVSVEQLLFFGGALRDNERASRAVATMLHAVTFRDEFNCMINFTSPGVARSFANDTARVLKSKLLTMAATLDDDKDDRE